MYQEIMTQLEAQLSDMGITEEYIQMAIREYEIPREDAVIEVIQNW